MKNRVLLIVVIILSLGIAGIVGCAYGGQNSLAPSQQLQPKYTQQEIADMQAELEVVEAALVENEKQQADTRVALHSWLFNGAVDAALGMVKQSAREFPFSGGATHYYDLSKECETKLSQLEVEHRKLLERKLLLVMKLGR